MRQSALLKSTAELQWSVLRVPNYALSKRLPSCAVPRQLLIDLERHVQERADALLKGEETERTSTVSVTDSMGTETMRNIEEYPVEVFPDDTRAISVELLAQGEHSLHVSIQFNARPEDSQISICFSGPKPRATAHSVLAGTEKIIGPYRTNHHFFLSKMLWSVIPAVWVAALAIQWRHLKLTWADVAIIVASIGLWTLTVLKPYTMFDTRRNQTKAKWAPRVLNSMLAGLLTVLIYAAVMPLMD